MAIFDKKIILITGGSGSFGKRFLYYLLENFSPKKIIIFSRDEHKHFNMQKTLPHKFNNKIRYFIGDVRDKERLLMATINVNIIIHAAALKHVPAAEYNPFEFVKTNIIGAQNIIECSMANKVQHTIALSTDKASSPINLYGATKLASDKLFVAANNYKGDLKTIFSVVRYGNVLGSNGSVVPFFVSQKKTGTITITDKNMTRFNITLTQSVEFVALVAKLMLGGEIFVPKLPSYKIEDLARAICKKSKFKYVGIRPGEKLHEEMISIPDSINTFEFNDFFIIKPNSEFSDWTIKQFNKKNKIINIKSKKNRFPYQSNINDNFLNINQIKNYLVEEKLL